MLFSSLRHRQLRVCVPVLALLMALPAQADAYHDVLQLGLQGKTAAALKRAREQSAQNPQDPQWHFLVGKLLQDSGQRDQALQVFTTLSQEFPDLPEPHNNRAVLLAARGELAQAREALEMALRANPEYALAHENLGDVYQRLAAVEYARARALGTPGTTSPAMKEKAP